MYSILLFKENTHVTDIPKWWYKFMENSGGRSFDTPEKINEFLQPMGATFRTTKSQRNNWGDRYLDFENEEAAIMFMLREMK